MSLSVSGNRTLLLSSIMLPSVYSGWISVSGAGNTLTVGSSSQPINITGMGSPGIATVGTGGTLVWYGNVTGGSGTNAYAISNSGTLTVNGNVTGGSGSSAYGVSNWGPAPSMAT